MDVPQFSGWGGRGAGGVGWLGVGRNAREATLIVRQTGLDMSQSEHSSWP